MDINMNENTSSRKREWVKNAAIIFLAVMLVLTFFSNTIMNYSLPEVATQYVQRGTITAKIRGTGNVEATDPYSVIVKESRVISSVAVKQGDEVEKGQTLYYLEDTESEELKQAEDELEELELAYMKGLFGGTVSPEVISKVASGNTDSFATYQAKVTDMQNRLEAAEDRVKECQDALDALNLQNTINSNNSSVSTLPYENEVTQATTDLENAQTSESNAQAEFEREKAEKIASLTSQITEKQKQITDLETLINGGGNTSGGTGTAASDYITQKKNAEDAVVTALSAIQTAASQGGYSGPLYSGTAYDSSQVKAVIASLENWITENEKDYDYQALLAAFYAAQAKLDTINSQQQEIIGSDSRSALAKKQEELEKLQKALAKVNAMSYEPGESVQDAKNRLNQAVQNLTDVSNANKQSSAAYSNKIANAEAALNNAQAVYDLLKTEQTELAADINAELDLSKTSKDIAEKKEEIAKLKEKSMGAEITAPVAGTVTSLAYVAGETTRPEDTAAVIQVAGKGFTLSFSVTNEQAKKVQVGDVAELQNAWYYDDAQAVLSAIKTDPESAGQKKLLVFDVTGSSIQAGQALNLSVGQRSAEYELVVPNSAIREDSNGKFILIVESKSGPISNRYIATRVDVEVLASDDNNTAISAGLYGYEYVITTSTKPVEAGKQVRLSDG